MHILKDDQQLDHQLRGGLYAERAATKFAHLVEGRAKHFEYQGIPAIDRAKVVHLRKESSVAKIAIVVELEEQLWLVHGLLLQLDGHFFAAVLYIGAKMQTAKRAYCE